MNSQKCFVVNVYSKCTLAGKRELWSKLIHLKRIFGGDVWCVVGDFNAVLKVGERRGVSSADRSRGDNEIREFKIFV